MNYISKTHEQTLPSEVVTTKGLEDWCTEGKENYYVHFLLGEIILTEEQ